MKFKWRKKPPLNTDRVIGGKLPIEGKPFPPGTHQGLPPGLHLMGPEIRKILFHSKPVALIAPMGQENDLHPLWPDLFSATIKMDLAKSIPK
jgi:hypothetical protein